MVPRRPYDWPKTYPPAYVWLGWDGISRRIDRDAAASPPRDR